VLWRVPSKVKNRMDRQVLIPAPRQFETMEGSLSIDPELMEKINSYTFSADLPTGISTRSLSTEARDQWYRLEIGTAGIEIIHNTPSGLFYAVQTLKQLIRQAPPSAGRTLKLSCCRIEDWPDFNVRGVLYDISRDRVPTMETLYGLIDLWAELKFNQLQLYMEHTFAYSRHKLVWKNASPLTSQEIQILDKYCRDRGIELVPNQNSFGHMEHWLKHPEYFHLAEAPEGFTDPEGVFYSRSSTLSPAVPETIDFLGDLYDELLPNFESNILNIGGDEPYELGQGRSADLCAEYGRERVYTDFLLKIHEQLSRRGSKMQVYGDIIINYPHLIKDLPDDITIINWGYEWNHPFEDECRIMSDSGLPFYICAGTSGWNTIGGRRKNAFQNILNAAQQGKTFGAEGFLISEWGDNGHWQQYPIALPGFLLASAVAWNLNGAADINITDCLALHVFRESEPRASQALMLLGDVWENDIAHLHNASIQAALLLDPVFPYHRQVFPEFKDYTFKKEIEILDEVRHQLYHVGPDFDNQILEELIFTASLMLHGCRLGRHQFSTPGVGVREISAPIRRELEKEISTLIAEYRRLWLTRSRPGGLDDSTARFEKLKKSYAN
jgi:hexosaminidase